jgi:hypothetical protein
MGSTCPSFLGIVAGVGRMAGFTIAAYADLGMRDWGWFPAERRRNAGVPIRSCFSSVAVIGGKTFTGI